jgi:hypothetical protein
MRKTAKELKNWLETIDDDALISVDYYKNRKTKEIILATEWGENLEEKENEFIVAELNDEE